MIQKRLYRSRRDRIIAGVFGGLGEYFNIDPVLLRVGWIVLFVVTGFIPGIIIYVLVLLVVPLEPEHIGPKVYTMPGSQSESSNQAKSSDDW